MALAGLLSLQLVGREPTKPFDQDSQDLHRNKRMMTLNLKDERGLAAFKRLAAKADVVLENFRPDV
ncbi:crotonobetainyl-CoA:carnitine CoA-transferase CaiB-like acyl-CoA transferase [Bradyrhizobium elkanii]|nr:crotonobetainyl-CoA:carnitine CoA-transferase CaiB-like acyl-CoA transferase [Bradyrhizobium elkanii]MCS3968746.1 crotonobetainyl-CoA:carnitine CoA-transferase CaiB-like acyl-CoA transferase [Bradyrhizobium japonicum]